MMSHNRPLTYDWRGHLIIVEEYEGPHDVSAIIPEHPTGLIEEGETHYRCVFAVSQTDGFWAPEEKFTEEAEPVGPEALKREGEWERDQSV